MGQYNFQFYLAIKEAFFNGVETHTFCGCPMTNSRPLADIAYGDDKFEENKKPKRNE